MTNKSQKVDVNEESKGSIGFLRASEKMWISTFNIPLTFLEDLGFSRKRTLAAKNFNQKFISGFYARVRSIGEKLSFGGRSKSDLAGQKSPPKTAKSAQAVKARKAETSTKSKPAKAVETARMKTSEQKNAASNAES